MKVCEGLVTLGDTELEFWTDDASRPRITAKVAGVEVAFTGLTLAWTPGDMPRLTLEYMPTIAAKRIVKEPKKVG